MSLPIHIALAPDQVQIDAAELTRVAGALSKQVDHDFAPVWKVRATVDPYARIEDIPLDAWPVIISRNVFGAAGYHEDENGQPYALVEFGADWSLTASHECLEMLADPFGRRLRAANLLDQAVSLGLNPGRVRYLVEVCDPSEASQFSYQINGVTVSDFYTPHFFDPVKVVGRPYSLTGAIDSPRTVLDGGYISWHDPVTRHWMQLRMFPDDRSSALPHVIDLNAETLFERFLQAGHNLRSAIDRVTRSPQAMASLAGDKRAAAQTSHRQIEQAQHARATALRETIRGLV